jgi:hypothetical protein
MILLNDILNLTNEEIVNTKVRFNQSDSIDFNPIELFKEKDKRLYEGQFWNYSKTKSFKEGQIAIGLIRVEYDKWLLFDISLITKDYNLYNAAGYEYQTIEKYKKFFGRVIIKFKNKSQNMIRRAESVINECEVYEIIDDTFDDDNFPGYENVDLSWFDLKRIVEKKDWKTALESQKGVYLITDISTGKRYVGSAYGEEMLLGRWKHYVYSGHGGNKDLKELEFSYIQQNFRYSILEIYKSTVDDKIIINREHFWMRILLSRYKSFGYNN